MEPFFWFMLEAFGAAALVAFLIWWSWPRKPRDDDPPDKA
jgi:hypothetical protein